MQWSTTSSQKYGLSVFQISEGSQVKNLSRSATWPDKLVEKLQWIGWSSGNLPIGILWLHPALKTWTLACFVRYCAQGSHWLQAAFRIWNSYAERYKLIKVMLLFLLLGQMLNTTTQTQKNVWYWVHWASTDWVLGAGERNGSLAVKFDFVNHFGDFFLIKNFSSTQNDFLWKPASFLQNGWSNKIPAAYFYHKIYST